MAGKRPTDLITAEEIACFVYCPEQWRLQYGLKLPSGNQAALKAGVRHHARKAWAERIAAGAIALGRLLVILALLALAVYWVVGR
jgi:hypothetical protein